MSPESIALVFGCLLLLIGIVGGGLELKELKVPQVNWATRLVTLVAGIAFIGVGLKGQFAQKAALSQGVQASQQGVQASQQGVQASQQSLVEVPPAPPVKPVAGGTSSGRAHSDTLFFMTRQVTELDLQGKSNWELDVMRNEIHARYGRRFARADLQEYFDKQSWYTPRYEIGAFPSRLLSPLQERNAQFILEYQQRTHTK
jgi:hypothetical protein